MKDGVSGFVTHTAGEFIERTARLLVDATLRAKMARAAREQAGKESWDEVFRLVYEGYETVLTRRSTPPWQLNGYLPTRCLRSPLFSWQMYSMSSPSSNMGWMV